MHEQSIVDKAYFLLLSVPFILPLTLALAVEGGSYLREAASGKWVFRPPPAGAVSVVTIPVWLYLSLRFALVYRAATVLFLRGIPIHPQTQGMLLVTGLIIVGIYWAVLLWFKMKWLLVVDLKRRTWRSLDISKLPFRVKVGTWNEIRGIQIVSQSKSGYYVQLRCNYPFDLYCTLGKFSSLSKAERFGTQMAQELGLPSLPMQVSVLNG